MKIMLNLLIFFRFYKSVLLLPVARVKNKFLQIGSINSFFIVFISAKRCCETGQRKLGQRLINIASPDTPSANLCTIYFLPVFVAP